MDRAGHITVRKTAIILSRNLSTPASYWVSMPLTHLAPWIESNNEYFREVEAKRGK